MKLASVRLVTLDLARLVSFYETLTGVTATRLAPEFAEVRLDGAVLALATENTVKLFNRGAAIAAANRSAILELEVDDVDGVYTRLANAKIDWVMEPSTMPWGNRSLLLRDPDGSLVNVFSRPKA